MHGLDLLWNTVDAEPKLNMQFAQCHCLASDDARVYGVLFKMLNCKYCEGNGG